MAIIANKQFAKKILKKERGANQMKKIFIVFLFIILTVKLTYAGNKAIIIEVGVTGNQSDLVKTTIENVLQSKGYTVTVTNDKSGSAYQKKNNSEMYNTNTGPPTGNKLIPSFRLDTKCQILTSYSDLYAHYYSRYISPFFEYTGQTMAILTLQFISYATDEIINLNIDPNASISFEDNVFVGTSNEYSFGVNSRYGHFNIDLGDSGQMAIYNATIDALERNNKFSICLDAIDKSIANSYYNQTVSDFQLYPPAQPPVNYNPNPNSNTSSQQQNNNYQSPQILQTSDPNLLSFSTIRNFSKLYAGNTLILDTNRDFSVYTDGKLWFEKIADNIQYCNGKSEKSDGNYFQIKIADLKNCNELCIKIGNVKWEFKINK